MKQQHQHHMCNTAGNTHIGKVTLILWQHANHTARVGQWKYAAAAPPPKALLRTRNMARQQAYHGSMQSVSHPSGLGWNPYPPQQGLTHLPSHPSGIILNPEPATLTYLPTPLVGLNPKPPSSSHPSGPPSNPTPPPAHLSALPSFIK